MVAQILYVFEKGYLSAWEVAELVRQKDSVDQESKGNIYHTSAYRFLVEREFHITTYGPDQNEDFLKRGLDFLKDHFGDAWDESREKYYTPKKVRELQDRTRKMEMERQRWEANGSFSWVKRHATLEDVTNHLRQRRAVIVSLPAKNRGGLLGLLVPHPDHPDGRTAWLFGNGSIEARGVANLGLRLDDLVDAVAPK